MIVEDNNDLLAIFTDMTDGNIAYHVPDDRKNVDNAREKLAQKYHFDLAKLCYMNQIHSNSVEIADPSQVFSCDGLITNKRNTPLMVMVADCIPILFYDLQKKAIGVAHAGRTGTFKNIASNTVNKLIHTYNCDPKDIKVVLGPSIAKCCYEVSLEIAEFTKESFGEEFVEDRNIDLQGINKMQLLQCGILEQNISILDICTKCSNQPFYSYRNDKICGRFAGILLLKQS